MSRLEQLASLPKLATVASGNLIVATVSGAYKAATAPEVHWMQVVVWACTALSFFGAGLLALVRTWVEIQKYFSNRRRRLRYQRLKRDGKLPPPLPLP